MLFPPSYLLSVNQIDNLDRYLTEIPQGKLREKTNMENEQMRWLWFPCPSTHDRGIWVYTVIWTTPSNNGTGVNPKDPTYQKKPSKDRIMEGKKENAHLISNGWCLHRAEKRTADYWEPIRLQEWQLNPKRCPDRDYCTQTLWRTKLNRVQLFPVRRHMPLTSTRRDRILVQSNLPALIPWLRSLASDQSLIT